MNFNYCLNWNKDAEQKLLKKVNYIFIQSKSVFVARKFYEDIKFSAEKRLTLIAHSVLEKEVKFYTLRNGHSVKFLVNHKKKAIYIIDFIAKGQSYN